MSCSSDLGYGTGRSQKRAHEGASGEEGPSRKRLDLEHSDNSEGHEYATSSSAQGDNRAVDTVSNPGQPETSHRHQPEDMLQFCRRHGYITDQDVVPKSKNMRLFLAFVPQRQLNDNNNKGQHKPLKFNTQNTRWYSVFIQIGGRVADKPCTKCARGSGRWTECVVAPTYETVPFFRGACGCCIYNHNPSQCSFAMEEEEEEVPVTTSSSTSGYTLMSANTSSSHTTSNSDLVPSRQSHGITFEKPLISVSGTSTNSHTTADSNIQDSDASTYAQLQADLEDTITRLKTVRAESNETADALNIFKNELLESSTLPPAADRILQLEKDLVETATRAGRLLAEKLSLKRRREYLRARLSESSEGQL